MSDSDEKAFRISQYWNGLPQPYRATIIASEPNEALEVFNTVPMVILNNKNYPKGKTDIEEIRTAMW